MLFYPGLSSYGLLSPKAHANAAGAQASTPPSSCSAHPVEPGSRFRVEDLGLGAQAFNVRALRIRTGFGGILYYILYKEPPK